MTATLPSRTDSMLPFTVLALWCFVVVIGGHGAGPLGFMFFSDPLQAIRAYREGYEGFSFDLMVSHVAPWVAAVLMAGATAFWFARLRAVAAALVIPGMLVLAGLVVSYGGLTLEDAGPGGFAFMLVTAAPWAAASWVTVHRLLLQRQVVVDEP